MLVYFTLLFGLALLLVGGDMLVRGAVGMAEKLSIPPLIIGLTVVAFGTSAPELFISVQAALDDVGGIAIGNVIGSNIANVLLILGLPALIAPCLCNEDGIGRAILVMIGFTLVYMSMLLDGNLNRFEGLVLLILIGLYLYGQVRVGIRHEKRGDPTDDYHEDVPNVPTSNLTISTLLLLGLLSLPYGADLTVSSASQIAKSWNISDAVIGLSIVAIGTSLPEMATAIAATFRGKSSLAIGNVVGSNIFNIGLIMGAAALIQPMPVAPQLLTFDIWVMLGAAVILALIAQFFTKIGKRVGTILTGLYIGYMVLVFVN